MNTSLIDEFRTKVNDHDLILQIYRNYNGRNKWNIICSAMDWIQVGVSGIDVSALEKTNTDQASIKVITFLSCIDVMWEGIQQLHRVFFNTKDIPFKGINNIFHGDMDDNDYWKEIRAAFAAHPTNLTKHNSQEKRYASWSGGGFGSSGDFSVILYSNDPSMDYEFFDISFDEIQAFATSRYEYLKHLMVQISNIKAEWCEKWRRRTIELTGDIVADIDILLKSNAERLSNDYCDYYLEEIKTAFSVEVHGTKNCAILDKYREMLKGEIEIIYHILQNMDLEYEIVDNNYEDYKYNYQNQIIFEPGKGLLSWAIESLKVPLGQYIDLDLCESIEELQVIVRAGWWWKHSVETN